MGGCVTNEGSALPDTDCYVYLGRVVSVDNNSRAEIMRRKKWSAMGSINEAAQLIADKKIRADLSNSTMLPASKTWVENKASTMMMARAQERWGGHC
ncbi:hypothetical protein TELCIR_18974 [Teladorsagia circumcincta]|uniref:Uncharacterized protein n=1 Tax=Teladorsagia circumcincta TaxID=45464 RepID=A0A2G9TNL4_TELCI|nr:hypothetical protein TELCIR_18974 [Teladorsagia circumcincta]